MISTACIIRVSRNMRICRCIFMFPRKNSARMGLDVPLHAVDHDVECQSASKKLTLNVRDRVISVKLGQYHGCWCPGSLRRQDISSHDIDCVEHVAPGLTWVRFLSTCVVSMWSNDIKCKYMIMFRMQTLARKELSYGTLLTAHW